VRVGEYNNAVVHRQRREGMAERKERKAAREREVTYSGNIKEETLEIAQQPEYVTGKLQCKKIF
jgi:hypothetical protein